LESCWPCNTDVRGRDIMSHKFDNWIVWESLKENNENNCRIVSCCIWLWKEFSERYYLFKTIFLWVIMLNTVILLYIAAVYNRPFSSFSPSFEHPPEFSPRTLKVETGLLSATSKSASNSTWCTKPIDNLPSNARCEHLSTYITLPSHYLVYSRPCTDPCEIMKKERSHVRRLEILRRHYFPC